MLTGLDILALVFVGALLLFLLSIPILRLTLDQRLRKALPPDKNYDAPTDWYFGFGRTIVFGWACVLPVINNSPRLRYLYNDFDVSAYANRFEKVIAFCMVGGLLVAFFSGILMYITEWLGIYEWPE